MPDTDHSHLTDSQRTVLHDLGWKSHGERRQQRRREFWRKAGLVLVAVAAIVAVVKIFGSATGANERVVPGSWDCSACTSEWEGYDYAAAHDFDTPAQCRVGMSDRQRQGCMTYVDELDTIQPDNL